MVSGASNFVIVNYQCNNSKVSQKYDNGLKCMFPSTQEDLP